MADDAIHVRVDTKVLDRIVAGGLDNVLRDVVETTALSIQRRAMQIVEETGRVDTGAMMNAFFVATSWGKDTYTEASAYGRLLNPDAGQNPDAKPTVQGVGFAANVGNAMEYYQYHEFGTAHMDSIKALRGPLAEHKAPFEKAVKAAIARLAP